MKYRIIKNGEDIDIITEDGGVASLHHNGENFVTTYYQHRIVDLRPEDDIWEELAIGKTYSVDWASGKPSEDEFIEDALAWLVVVPAPREGFERDDSIFPDIFPDVQPYENVFSFDDERIKWARKCDECSLGMNAGYVINGGEEYYCSETCLHKHYSQLEFAEMAGDDGEADTYYTEWEDKDDFQYEELTNGEIKEIEL